MTSLDRSGRNGPTGEAMGPPLRVALVGVGGRGSTWVEAFTATPEWQPVALVDIDSGFLASAREATGLGEDACSTSLSEALGWADADAVSIAVPARLHAELIEQALQTGKHVLVEKPFTTSLTDAERLVELAEQQDRVILVVQNGRYSPIARTLQRLVAEEVFGPLGFLTIVHHKARGTPYPYCEDMHLWGQGVHELDLMRCVTGRPVQSVMGRSVQPNWSTWPSEAMAEALISFGPRPDRPHSTDLVYGTYVGTSDARAPSYSLRLECADAAIVAGHGSGEIQALRGTSVEDLPLDELTYTNTEQHLAQLFHHSICRGEEPETSGRRNLETMRLATAIIESGHKGQAIEFGKH